mgnify:CR=1 FL=1
MKLVVCLDENNGIKFFGKRQSQDELQRKNLFELIGNLKLFLTEYSYNLYKDVEFNFEIIDENTEIIKNSVFLYEGDFLEKFLPSVDEIIVYFWNSDANSEVIIGHYILSAAFTIWAILGYLYSKGTWIDVIDDGEREDSRMIIRNPFEGERIFMMSEIGEVKLEKDTAMYIYDADGNLVISISDTADNFDLLAQNLEWHNKKIKEVSRLEMLRALPRELIKEIRKSRHKER